MKIIPTWLWKLFFKKPKTTVLITLLVIGTVISSIVGGLVSLYNEEIGLNVFCLFMLFFIYNGYLFLKKHKD